MIVEAYDRNNWLRLRSACSDELTSEEILTRFGLKGRPWYVVKYPDGRPDKAHCIQQIEVGEG